MEDKLKQMLGDRYAELDLVVCVLPEVKNLYEAVKRWAEATTGIAVQCCKALKIMGDGRARPLGNSPQYHAGTNPNPHTNPNPNLNPNPNPSP